MRLLFIILIFSFGAYPAVLSINGSVAFAESLDTYDPTTDEYQTYPFDCDESGPSAMCLGVFGGGSFFTGSIGLTGGFIDALVLTSSENFWVDEFGVENYSPGSFGQAGGSFGLWGVYRIVGVSDVSIGDIVDLGAFPGGSTGEIGYAEINALFIPILGYPLGPILSPGTRFGLEITGSVYAEGSQGNGNHTQVSYVIHAVEEIPEPSTGSLLALGIVGIELLRRASHT